MKNVANAVRRKNETESSLPVPTSDGKKYFHQLRVSIQSLKRLSFLVIPVILVVRFCV